MARRTPLYDVHRDLGATFTEFAGWSMPLRYSSEIREHHAVRTAGGLFDLSHMGQVEVTGPDAAAALDHALVGRSSTIGIGRAKYSMVCDHDGGVLDDVIVYRLAERRYLVVANAGNTAVVAGVVRERSRPFDAAVDDVSAAWALIAVQGPASAAVVDEVSDLEVAAMRYYSVEEGTIAGRGARVARTGYTGEDGFEICCASADAVRVWAAVAAAGAGHGVVPAGLACRDTLRLEAGMPLYGHELGRGQTPFEAGLERVIAFDKPGGFVGAGALEHRRATGATTRLVGVRAAGRRSPRTGNAVLDPDSGAEVGVVTSGALSPTLGHPIAFAHVSPALGEPGTRLVVDVRGSALSVEVVTVPFYRRPQ